MNENENKPLEVKVKVEPIKLEIKFEQIHDSNTAWIWTFWLAFIIVLLILYETGVI